MTDVRAQVERFLRRIRNVARDRRHFDLIPRASTNSLLLALGLNSEAVRQEIVGLGVDDYSSGPEEDRDRPGEVWVFGRQVENLEVYIKLKLVKDSATGQEYLKCLSFHEAAYRLKYPLRGHRAN